MEKTFNYHKAIKIELDSINKVINNKELSDNYIGNKTFRHDNIKGWNGIDIANIDNTAFEATKVSGILKEFDFEIIQKISKVYKMQDSYSEFGKSILTKMINFDSSTKVSDVIGSLELVTYDLSYQEKKLIDEIENTLKQIKTLHNPRQ